MESLPLELHEQIFSYLLPPRSDWTSIVAVPVSTGTARSDIYSLRLTSRRINRAVAQPFAQIIGDIPTKCTAESLHILAKLLKSADVGPDVTCLTLDVCKLYVTRKQTLSQLRVECSSHDEWIKDCLDYEVQAVLRETPRLRHLICLPAAVRGIEKLEFSHMQRVNLEMTVKDMPDPILYIQHALESTKFNESLETMAVLHNPFATILDATSTKKEILPMECPMLTHLTVSPPYFELSDFHVRSPNLKYLHIALDDCGDAFDTGSADCIPVDNIQPELHSLILSGGGYLVHTALLLQCIVPATTKIKRLSLLTIRDMDIVMDINYGVEELPGEGRFKELLFENVKYCFTDEMTLSGPSIPTELNNKWKALPRLCERADCVRVKMDGVERVMEPYEWADKDAI